MVHGETGNFPTKVKNISLVHKALVRSELGSAPDHWGKKLPAAVGHSCFGPHSGDRKKRADEGAPKNQTMARIPRHLSNFTRIDTNGRGRQTRKRCHPRVRALSAGPSFVSFSGVALSICRSSWYSFRPTGCWHAAIFYHRAWPVSASRQHGRALARPSPPKVDVAVGA